jgi:HAD superfamily hydrolase (TIGR01509 family)
LKVKAVVFDLGRVLVDFDYGIAARKLAAQSKAGPGEIQALIDQSPLLFRYESAQMTTQQFFEAVRERIGFAGNFDQFAAAFADIFTEMPEMIRLHETLRGRGLPTFVLSNTNEIAVGHVRRNFPFYSTFTGYILSFEQAALKPHERIYEIAEQRSGCRGGEILFLDDKPENAETGARRGWKTICHQSAEESIRAVEALVG